MTKRILELLIVVAIGLSPLLHSSLEDSVLTRTMWSWLLLISGAIIAFFAMYHFRVQRIFLAVITFFVATLFFSFLIAVYPFHPLALFTLCVLLFLFLAIETITKTNPRTKTIFIILLIACTSLYAQWGIAQFIIQHDLGLRTLGEPLLTRHISGVASFYIGSEKYIRSYGPFGHANSLGGVLLLGIILLFTYRKWFSNTLFFAGTLFTISLALITSFSRNALLGLFVIAIAFLYTYKKRLILVPIIIAGFLFIPLLSYRSADTRDAAVSERLMGLYSFKEITSPSVLLRGLGIGNYTTAIRGYFTTNSIAHNPWDVAPVHSTPLFILAELGIILFLFICFSIGKYVVAHKAWVLVVLLPALFFDHYFATQFAPCIFLITCARLVVQ